MNSVVTVTVLAVRATWLAFAAPAATCRALAATLPCLSPGPAPSSPLSPSPFPICCQELVPSQAVGCFFVLQQAIATMLLSSSFLKLLCPPLPATASHRGHSSRLAVHCTEARSAAAWCCRARPAVAWPQRHQAGCQPTSSTGAPQPWLAPRRRTARPPPR